MHDIPREAAGRCEHARKPVKNSWLLDPCLASSLPILCIILGHKNGIEIRSVPLRISGRKVVNQNVVMIGRWVVGAVGFE